MPYDCSIMLVRTKLNELYKVLSIRLVLGCSACNACNGYRKILMVSSRDFIVDREDASLNSS